MKGYLLGGTCLLLTGICLAQAPSNPMKMMAQEAAPCSQYRTPVRTAPDQLDQAMLMDERNRTVVARGKVIDPCRQQPQLTQSDEAQKRLKQLETQRKAALPKFPLPGQPAPPPVKLKSATEMLQESLKPKTPLKP